VKPKFRKIFNSKQFLKKGKKTIKMQITISGEDFDVVLVNGFQHPPGSSLCHNGHAPLLSQVSREKAESGEGRVRVHGDSEELLSIVLGVTAK